MKAEITTWGNSLGLRVPKKIIEALGLLRGSKVKMNLVNNKIVIEKLEEEFFTSMSHEKNLKDLMAKVNDKNLHSSDEYEEDGMIGREVW